MLSSKCRYQPINDQIPIKTTKNHYQLIAVDQSKQKELDADPRAIQQIEFYSMLSNRVLSKETIFEFYKKQKFCKEHING